MAELEKNQETVEETVEAIEEGQQPNAKAEDGDKKPVKQGSSDAEKIESGKGDVVKPEENPVDKAVASVKAAEKAPSNEGDAQKKGADKPEKMEKLKKVSEGEEESKKDVAETSKMENIKAIVNNMKEMTKEELQKTFGEVSEEEEEVDESLTKAEVARKIVETLKKLDAEEVAKIREKYEDEEDDDGRAERRGVHPQLVEAVRARERDDRGRRRLPAHVPEEEGAERAVLAPQLERRARDLRKADEAEPLAVGERVQRRPRAELEAALDHHRAADQQDEHLPDARGLDGADETAHADEHDDDERDDDGGLVRLRGARELRDIGRVGRELGGDDRHVRCCCPVLLARRPFELFSSLEG